MKTLIICLLSTAVFACASAPVPKKGPVQKLQWLDAANPQNDANQAIKRQDYRLMALDQRGLIIPAIPRAQSRAYELKCGIHYIRGVSDVIFNQEHLRLTQKARRYALKYNAIIKTVCQP